MGVDQNVRTAGGAYLSAKAEAEKLGYRVSIQRDSHGLEMVVVSGGPEPVVPAQPVVETAPAPVADTPHED